jgi:hypothetical protein
MPLDSMLAQFPRRWLGPSGRGSGSTTTAPARRAARAAVAEPGGEFLVADLVAGQVSADAGDICLSHEVH